MNRDYEEGKKQKDFFLTTVAFIYRRHSSNLQVYEKPFPIFIKKGSMNCPLIEVEFLSQLYATVTENSPV